MKHKSLLFFGIVAACYLCSLCYFSPWKWAVTGGGDPWGYYAYLPATFVYHDLNDLKSTVEQRKRYAHSVFPTPENPLGIGEALPVGNGNYVIKYTMGVALLEAPFFAAAHAYTLLVGGFPSDGFSLPYIFAIHFAAVFYVLIGLYLLWKTLRRYFPERTAFAVVAAIALATHLFYFTAYAGVMAHAFLFFLFAGVVYASEKWYATGQRRYALWLGAACGMVVLVRPTDGVVLAVPLLLGLKNRADLVQRWAFYRQHIGQIGWAALVAFLVVLPQLAYWKWTSGHFFYYSYGGEGFNFLRPQVWKGLFSYKNGWLAYTPLMALGIVGMPLLWRHGRHWFWPVAVFLPLHVYIVYSWWCWNYINGFGSRPMVEAAVLMAFPLAAFFKTAAQKRWSTGAVAVAVLFFTWLNVFQTWQFSRGLIWTEAGKPAFIWRMFGQTQLDYLDLVVFDSGEPQPDTGAIRLHRVLFANDFEALPDSLSADTLAFSGRRSFYLTPARNGTVAWSAPIGSLGLEKGDWLKLSVNANASGKSPSYFEGSFLLCRFKRGDRPLKTRSIRIESKIGNNPVGIWGGLPNQWGDVYFWVKPPHALRPGDRLQVEFHILNGQPCFLDDLSVEVWKRR